MAPSVKVRYEEEKKIFIAAHKDKGKPEGGRDMEYKYTFFTDVKFHRCTDVPFTLEKTLVYEEKLGSKPWYAENRILIFLDVFMLGWI